MIDVATSSQDHRKLSFRNDGTSSAAPTPASSWVTPRRPCSVSGWRNEAKAEPEDLSGNLIVQLGLVTGALNRHWYERNTGQAVECVQHRLRHPVLRWMGATLDGIVAGSGVVFEAKFVLPWSLSEEAAAGKHMAQLQHKSDLDEFDAVVTTFVLDVAAFEVADPPRHRR